MRIQIVVLALALGLAVGSMGCGANVWGMKLAVFDASVGTDCKGGECKEEVKANGLSVPGAEFAKYLIDTIVRVGSELIPGGLKPKKAEVLDVRLLEDDE